MMLLVRWALISLGLTYLLTQASILALPRSRFARGSGFRAGLIYCAACTGFWVGLGTGSWLWPYSMESWQAALEGGFATMALGALWAWVQSGNPAWDAESELREPPT